MYQLFASRRVDDSKGPCKLQGSMTHQERLFFRKQVSTHPSIEHVSIHLIS